VDVAVEGAAGGVHGAEGKAQHPTYYVCLLF
jgi:hypothetical protein